MHAIAEATEHLKQHCLNNICPHVYAPQIEETVDVTSDLCAYKVRNLKLIRRLLLTYGFQVVIEFNRVWW